jgi:hypothetical protein
MRAACGAPCERKGARRRRRGRERAAASARGKSGWEGRRGLPGPGPARRCFHTSGVPEGLAASRACRTGRARRVSPAEARPSRVCVHACLSLAGGGTRVGARDTTTPPTGRWMAGPAPLNPRVGWGRGRASQVLGRTGLAAGRTGRQAASREGIGVSSAPAPASEERAERASESKNTSLFPPHAARAARTEPSGPTRDVTHLVS